jgi:hypothetical protein
MTSSSNSARPRSRPASHEISAQMYASMPLTLRPGEINRRLSHAFGIFSRDMRLLAESIKVDCIDYFIGAVDFALRR